MNTALVLMAPVLTPSKRKRRASLPGIARAVAVSVTATFTLTLALTGCANDDAAGEPSAGTAPAPSTTDVAAGAEAEGVDTAADPESGDPVTCLHGEWTADNDYFLSNIGEFGDEVKDVSGAVTLSFGGDGSLTTEYRDWLITAIVDGGTVTIHRNGTDSGTFSATETTVTLTETQMGSAMTMTAAGVEMPIDPAPISYTDVDFACTSRTASITTPDGTLMLARQ